MCLFHSQFFLMVFTALLTVLSYSTKICSVFFLFRCYWKYEKLEKRWQKFCIKFVTFSLLPYIYVYNFSKKTTVDSFAKKKEIVSLFIIHLPIDNCRYYMFWKETTINRLLNFEQIIWTRWTEWLGKGVLQRCTKNPSPFLTNRTW